MAAGMSLPTFLQPLLCLIRGCMVEAVPYREPNLHRVMA